MKYRIINWSEFQHYKDRCPPWIKLHNSLISSEVWVMSNDATRALIIASMLLASRNTDNDGTFNGNPEYIKRFAYLNSAPNFKPLIEFGFIELVQDASAMLASCNTEERREEKRREETDKCENSPEFPPGPADENSIAEKCPYQEIVRLYHEILPNHPKVRELTSKRKSHMKARWSNGMEKNIELFREYFEVTKQSPFLTGKVDPPPGRKRFIADFDFLISEKAYIGILEGKYFG